jgi:electron transport complex protein RnfB
VEENAYKLLAERLDQLPNGFPSTPEGLELALLAKLFTPDEAYLASQLRLTLESVEQIANRLGRVAEELRLMLKGMAKRGLIVAGAVNQGLGYGLMPFVVGIYEMQIGRIDAELAALFEAYYQKAFHSLLSIQPQVHRVIPVHESIRMDMEIQPYENVMTILDHGQSWGVVDCICRLQKALIGEACSHPVDVCMILSEKPGAFEHSSLVRDLTRQEAVETLERASRAGLVHTVSNNQRGTWYICNCCTCSCGILRGMSELGIANVVARSEFINQVDETLCTGCGDCVNLCQFNALSVADSVLIESHRCVGCGVCVSACVEGALGLVKRPQEEIKPPPMDEREWQRERAAQRGVDITAVL